MSTTTLMSVFFSALALGWSNPSSFWQYITPRFLDIGWNTPSRHRNITRRISGMFGGATELRGAGEGFPHFKSPVSSPLGYLLRPLNPGSTFTTFTLFVAALVFSSANEKIRTLCKVSWGINLCFVITFCSCSQEKNLSFISPSLHP